MKKRSLDAAAQAFDAAAVTWSATGTAAGAGSFQAGFAWSEQPVRPAAATASPLPSTSPGT